ncbi:uncharacterized protein GLRG_02453 [Colletotrichum graminicola M1.001]|uniref:Uncharacterized protein n=1 Tax=Colletotrichum graminicola (strain M1.001 / M2 / FGSC 10212) TaxID=645133 RepID=E3Q6Z5_COLGM|nr:uncharacterized protein GLRG_02453 [Colletotrichum graminicola M1.001]EFQ26633.1 hypothetical protein GLRG_02453 [Colletotrichum graminicola M1.001]
MGSANSHEIRQIVDEAVVALRSGQHQQQRQSSRHHRRSEVISLDEDDDGVLFGEEGDYATYSTDDDGVWEPGYDSGSEEPVCGEECCSDSGWSECCYETVECCVGGGGRGRDRGWRHERCGVEAKKEKACKECEKKRMCRKCRKKAPSFWSRCYPVSGRRDWGGGVVGVSRCPGERLAAVSGGHWATACGRAPDGVGTLRRGPGRREWIAATETRSATDPAVRGVRCVPPRCVE